jgi:predicted DNA-binding transcriptional regulator AlpA
MQKETFVTAPQVSEDTITAPYEASDLRPLPDEPDALIRAADVPSYVGIARQTMSRWRHEGNPPRYVRLGRRVFYRSGDLRDWIRSQVRENTIV